MCQTSPTFGARTFGANTFSANTFSANTLSGRITVEGDQRIGRGYLIAGIDCKSQTWSRVR